MSSGTAVLAPAVAGAHVPAATISQTVDASQHKDISDLAVWTISTAKPGNGVEQLRDDNLETYWQSDGGQPHLINIQFTRKTQLSQVCVYLDYGLDESYTPKRMGVRCGTTLHDLTDICTVELAEPVGWVTIPLFDPLEGASCPLRTHMLQIRVYQMHQNGRDTHVRQVKVFNKRAGAAGEGSLLAGPKFVTVDMLQHATIR
jgi:anaphase-promoting complex subunit 10